MFKKIIQIFSKKQVQEIEPTEIEKKVYTATAKRAYQRPIFKMGDKVEVLAYIAETQHYICNIPASNILNIKIPCHLLTPDNFIDPTVSKVVSISTATEN